MNIDFDVDNSAAYLDLPDLLDVPDWEDSKREPIDERTHDVAYCILENSNEDSENDDQKGEHRPKSLEDITLHSNDQRLLVDILFRVIQS